MKVFRGLFLRLCLLVALALQDLDTWKAFAQVNREVLPSQKFVFDIDSSETVRCLLPSETLIRWYDSRGQELSSVSGLERFKAFTNGTFIINKVHLSDGGTYECRGLKYTRFYIIYINARFTKKNPHQTLTADMSGILSCSAEGNPAPLFMWSRKDGKPLNEERFRQLHNGNLYVYPVLPEDRGEYICTIKQHYDGREDPTSKFQNMEVSVIKKPYAEITPKSHPTLMIGDPLSLTCKVNEATLEIKWKKDGASEIPRAEIFPIRDESTLFISKVVTSDSGEYSCEAHNRAGIASSTLKINVRENTKNKTDSMLIKEVFEEKPCEDLLSDCAYHFINADESCERYSVLTRKYCSKTCDYCPTPPPTMLPPCKDMLPDCAVYIKSPSQCLGAQEFFTKYCPSTCGFCACDDILADCSSYVTSPQQCQSFQFFTKYCRKTCNVCGNAITSSPATSTTNAPSPSTASSLTPPTSTTKSQSPSTTSPSTGFPSTKSPSTKSSSTKSPSTKSPTIPPSATKSTIQPGPLGCADILRECASMVANDKDSCTNREEYMKENCPESCNLCGVDLHCKDKMPEHCSSLIARDKEYCKTKPEFMRENCARTCEYCGCHDLLPLCPSLVANNQDYCADNPLFMKTNCPKSCNICDDSQLDSDVKPPTTNGCVDKRTKCKEFAGYKNYCLLQAPFMRKNCPKSCQFCDKEHRFAIKTEWNGAQINHAPITFQISAQDSRVVRISVSGPFFDDPGPPPCAVGSACDGLWDYEVAEVFFLGKQDKYLEIELSPHGQHLLLMLNGVRKPFLDKLPIKYTATIDRAKKTWTGIAKIPIAYFPPGVRKMNAYAIHGSGSGRRYESLYPASADVKNPDFHRLEFFKPFDFEAMFTLSWSKPLSLYWKNVRRLMRARSRT